jgi:hypothetical protein
VPVSHDIRFTCRTPACGQHIVVDVSEAGRAVKCPACGRPQRVPGDPPKPLVREPPPTPVRRAWEQLTDYKPLRRFKHEDQVVVWFFVVALVGLLVFGLAKLSTPWVRPGYAGGRDVVLGLSMKQVVIGLGVLEWAVVAACAGVASTRTAGLILLWFAGNWWVYRVGQLLLGQRRVVPALGVWGDMLGMRDETADRLMMGFTMAVAVGAALIVWRQWRIKQDEERKKRYERRKS